MTTVRARGFTLLELVVALGVFAVVSVMAYGGLNTVLNSRRAVENAMDETANFQRAYLRLRNDLQLVTNRPARNGLGQPDPALMTTSDGRLEFTRAGWSNGLLRPRSTAERVSYRLDEDHRLVRASWRVLDRAQESEPVPSVVLEGVEELRWRFLDASGQWQEHWPPQTVGSFGGATSGAPPSPPPLAVEVTLRQKAWGELRFLFRVTAS
ncbi:MAG TPA: type II secretion system minor pseudopilin GspJ [Candidatus Binatia bacterium]|nr:type II secretion system minor pseudopilin GspJ [Candidatus Binatia bacterium]